MVDRKYLRDVMDATIQLSVVIQISWTTELHIEDIGI
jgi:hypothetical protein